METTIKSVGKESLIRNKLNLFGCKVSAKGTRILIQEYNEFKMPISKRLDEIIGNFDPFLLFVQNFKK